MGINWSIIDKEIKRQKVELSTQRNLLKKKENIIHEQNIQLQSKDCQIFEKNNELTELKRDIYNYKVFFENLDNDFFIDEIIRKTNDSLNERTYIKQIMIIIKQIFIS